jgi:hypothetical protein
MRTIKLKLKHSNPFWSLPPIILNKANPESSLIDIDQLTIEQKDLIQNARDYGEISIFDKDGKLLYSIYDAKNIGEYNVSTADINKSDIAINVPSITVDIDEEKEDIFEEEIEEEDLSGLREKAQLLAEKNGNTIRKILQTINKTDKDSISFIKAFIEIESNNKNRIAIIQLANSLLK